MSRPNLNKSTQLIQDIRPLFNAVADPQKNEAPQHLPQPTIQSQPRNNSHPAFFKRQPTLTPAEKLLLLAVKDANNRIAKGEVKFQPVVRRRSISNGG